LNLTTTGVAAEIFAASWCNLDCAYCSIPKHNQMIKDKHQEIIRDIIAVTPIINRLRKLYEKDQLVTISHWGSEPTLTLQYFDDFYVEAVKEFPNLNSIQLSSNFMTRPGIISKFISNLPLDREFTIDVQMSLDGESWVTEVNRGEGTTIPIQNNIVQFIRDVNAIKDLKHEVKVHFKPTMSKDQYESLLTGDKLEDHYRFFDQLLIRMYDANIDRKVSISNDCDPTLVCPDKYTKRDGQVLSEFYKAVNELGSRNLYKYAVPSFSTYYGTIDRVMKYGNELFTKSRMFTCSAGDTQFGISEYVQPCHDTFYTPYDEVQDAIRNDLGRINSSREVDNLDSGRTKNTKRTMFVKIEGITQQKMDKFQYFMRGFHDFYKFRVSFAVSVIFAMAKCGQVNPCYKNKDMATLLAIFATNRHSCLTRNNEYTGSMHLTDPAYFKLFGNGLLEQIIEKGLSK